MASPFESFKKVNNFEYENSNLYVNFAENVNQQANQRVLQTMQKSTSPQSMSAKATARRTFNDTNKVFIGGISHSTTEETLHAYFSKFGQLIDCVIIKDPKTNNPKGFGFVQYPESGMVDELMKNRPHTIDNRQLDVHRSIPRALAKKQEVKNRNVTKLFVAGLNHDIISESDLRTFFETFGTVLSVQIPKDKETNRLKSFAFITFDDYDPVDKITMNQSVLINGFQVYVAKATEQGAAEKTQTRSYQGQQFNTMSMNQSMSQNMSQNINQNMNQSFQQGNQMERRSFTRNYSEFSGQNYQNQTNFRPVARRGTGGYRMNPYQRSSNVFQRRNIPT